MNSITDKPSDSKGAAWKFALLGGLADPVARRIYTTAELQTLVREYRPTASPNTARVTVEMLVDAGALRKVSGGVYLNRRATPPAEMDEIAGSLRSGAVISLLSVLGKSGFLNNIADEMVTAVVPTSATKRPNLGLVTTSQGDRFHFFGLAERFFPSNDEERFEMLRPGSPCPTFRPEAALLHWLHLAAMNRSKLTAPPVDVDMDVLDQELLGKLAEKWALGGELMAWRARAEGLHFGAEPEMAAVAPPAGADPSRSDDAKQRLLRRRAP
ncbi:hypothetical protein ABIC83_002840 [Roseateles asaccharophilus]|uniref:hypothetical protein n=1 Tax=Roseateles asaccharophilus TaxID=582607 RepID=UPI0038368F2F